MQHKNTLRNSENLITKTHGISIRSSFSNTFFAFVDSNNNVIARLSAGCMVERSRRSSYFAAIVTGMEFAKKVQSYGINSVSIHLKGVGPGRDAAIRGLKVGGLKVKKITDTTHSPHNGCRAPKKRRI